METMYIYKNLPLIAIEVEGYPPQNFFDYSLKEAEKKYREKYGLKMVHFKKDFSRSHWETNWNGRNWVY